MPLTKLSNRVIDDDGNVIYYQNGLVDYLYKYKHFPNEMLFFPCDDVEKFNKYMNYYNGKEQLDLPTKLINHEERKNKWFYPEEYDLLDLEEYFLNLCLNDKEKARVILELNEYKKSGMEKLLRFCIYLADQVKINNWVIGVGRGSSVNSYLLKLIDLHQIDSIKYDLDIKDFLKD